MPFFLYSLDSEQEKYRQIREISLSGRQSPFPNICTELGDRWHCTDTDILSHLGDVEPAEHRILIDLKPSDKTNVSLYRLRDVWGYSYESWTPLALRLESLLVDDPRDNPTIFKQEFVGPKESGDFIYEFLYLNGGTKGGKWTWGMVGRVNGALLWPDALRYFINRINAQLVSDKLEPLYETTR